MPPPSTQPPLLPPLSSPPLPTLHPRRRRAPIPPLRRQRPQVLPLRLQAHGNLKLHKGELKVKRHKGKSEINAGEMGYQVVEVDDEDEAESDEEKHEARIGF